MDRNPAASVLAEMQIFAGFSAAEQRFIRRSIDVGLGRGNAIACWARGPEERAAIERQARRYAMIRLIRTCLSDDEDPAAAEAFLAPLISMSAGDLGEGKLTGFEAYRFLYERLLGPMVRPWLVSAFAAAAAVPALHPQLRTELLQSIPLGEALAAGWSIRDPMFFPQWVDKVEMEVG